MSEGKWAHAGDNMVQRAANPTSKEWRTLVGTVEGVHEYFVSIDLFSCVGCHFLYVEHAYMFIMHTPVRTFTRARQFYLSGKHNQSMAVFGSPALIDYHVCVCVFLCVCVCLFVCV